MYALYNDIMTIMFVIIIATLVKYFVASCIFVLYISVQSCVYQGIWVIIAETFNASSHFLVNCWIQHLDKVAELSTLLTCLNVSTCLVLIKPSPCSGLSNTNVNQELSHVTTCLSPAPSPECLTFLLNVLRTFQTVQVQDNDNHPLKTSIMWAIISS